MFVPKVPHHGKWLLMCAAGDRVVVLTEIHIHFSDEITSACLVASDDLGWPPWGTNESTLI